MDATNWMGLVITTVGVAASGLLLFLGRRRRTARAAARSQSAPEPPPPLHLRQGDVLLLAEALPAGLRPAPDGVLAHGEATGHAHRLDLAAAEVFVDEQGTLFCRTRDSARLTHEEHGPITLPAGTWRVVRQREFRPDVNRVVAD